MFLLFACAKPVEPAAPEVGRDLTPPVVTSDPAQRVHMMEHLAHGTAARDKLIAGDLEGARLEAAWVADHEPEPTGIPSEWGGWITEMRAAAGRASAAKDADEVGRSLAQMANACGGCHESLQVSPRLSLADPLPPPDGSVHRHMERHQWAADRMWAALILPSSQAWTEAMGALSEAPLHPDELGGSMTLQQEAWATTVREKPRAALGDDNPDTRADLYGEVVAACSGCHQSVKK